MILAAKIDIAEEDLRRKNVSQIWWRQILGATVVPSMVQSFHISADLHLCFLIPPRSNLSLIIPCPTPQTFSIPGSVSPINSLNHVCSKPFDFSLSLKHRNRVPPSLEARSDSATKSKIPMQSDQTTRQVRTNELQRTRIPNALLQFKPPPSESESESEWEKSPLLPLYSEISPSASRYILGDSSNIVGKAGIDGGGVALPSSSCVGDTRFSGIGPLREEPAGSLG